MRTLSTPLWVRYRGSGAWLLAVSEDRALLATGVGFALVPLWAVTQMSADLEKLVRQ